MKIIAWCIMANHVHLVFQSVEGGVEGQLRSYYLVTSKGLLVKQ